MNPDQIGSKTTDSTAKESQLSRGTVRTDRASHSFLLLTLLLFLAAGAFHCFKMPNEPVMPMWDVTANLPLFDTLRTVKEMVEKDTTIVQVNALTHLISFAHTDRAVSDSIGDRIALSPRDGRMGISIGVIKIDSVEIASSAAPFPTTPFAVPVPPTTQRAGALLTTVPNFSNLDLQSGIATLTVRNDLPVPIEFPEPIELTDGLNRVLAVFSSITGTIEPGGTRTATDDLAGRSTNNTIRISTTGARDSITVRTPGSGTTPVQFTSASRIAFGVKFTQMRVTSATARIPEQSLLRKDSSLFVADDSIFVQSLRFKSGAFTIQIQNQVDVPVEVHLRLPQFLKSGVPFDSTLLIPQRGTLRLPFEMRDIHVFSTTPTRVLVYSAEIRQLGSSGTDLRTINSTDSVIVALNFSASKLVVRSGSGIIKPIRLNLDQRISLRMGELPGRFSVDSIRLPDARVTLNLTTPGFPVRIHRFRIRASKGNIVDSIQYRTGSVINLLPSGVNALVFNDANSTIVEVMNRFVARARTVPDSFRIIADSAIVNPDYDTTATRYAADTSKIQGTFAVDFPLNIGLRNGVVRDTIDIADKISIKKEDIDNINVARLSITVLNKIPASFRATFILTRANYDSFWVLPGSGPISVTAAPVGADGFSSSRSRSDISISISKRDVDALVAAKFIRLKLELNTTPAAPSVKFRTTDEIQMGVGATLSYRIKKD